MSKKLKYGFVKKFIEDAGYVLLSEEYVGVDEKLMIRCPKDHEYERTFYQFRGSVKCPVCAAINRSWTKWDTAKVREVLASAGYKLLSEYTNAHTSLLAECPKKHQYKVRISNFLNGTRCSRCSGNIKPTLEELKAFFSTEGYKLLSTEYKNTTTKLEVLCPVGHKWLTTRSNFLQGKRCPFCCGTRFTIDKVRRMLEKDGYRLLSEKYNNDKEKLKLKCPKGHTWFADLHAFRKGYRCPICMLSGPVSKVSQEWLDYLGLDVSKREQSICVGDKTYIVDAYDKETNTVYEFFGDYWHGNPKVFNPNDTNPHNKRTYGELYEATVAKIKNIESSSYDLIYIWEKDYREMFYGK